MRDLTIHSHTLTMSSREIAEITGKAHRHVRRDIAKMLEQVGDDVSKFGHIYRDARNRQQTEYRLDKRLTLNLITGYDAKLRLKIIDRLEELERGPAIPQTLSEALLLAAEQAEQIEAMRPKAAALDRLSGADGSLCMTDAAKAIGVRPRDLIQHLHESGWIYRRTGGSPWVAKAWTLTKGIMEHKITTVERTDGSERVHHQARVTAQGVALLAGILGTPDMFEDGETDV